MNSPLQKLSLVLHNPSLVLVRDCGMVWVPGWAMTNTSSYVFPSFVAWILLILLCLKQFSIQNRLPRSVPTQTLTLKRSHSRQASPGPIVSDLERGTTQTRHNRRKTVDYK